MGDQAVGTFVEVFSIPKGQRPNPNTYLDAGYIQQHLAKFDNGASRIVTKLVNQI